MPRHTEILPIFFILLVAASGCKKDYDSLSDENRLSVIAENLLFAEGPVFNNETLYFSDLEASIIYKWTTDDGLKIFREDTGSANGLFFNKNNNLLICEGGNKRVISLSTASVASVVTDSYGNAPYNEPNDIWVSSEGNIYFTDPVFKGTLSQDGEHVYCVLASTGNVIRVTSDLIRPNGITGNKYGSVLYIADYGASKIYRYDIQPDGSLMNKELFVSLQADGIDTDSDGNLYAASNGIKIFSPDGLPVSTIPVPGTATNSCVSEYPMKTIFITTHNAVYKYILE